VRITSTRNPIIREIRDLATSAGRREQGAYFVEGVRLVREAIETGQRPRLALYDREALSRTAAGRDLLAAVPQWSEHAFEVDARVLRSAADTEAPAGVLAVLALPQTGSLGRHRDDRFGLILDRLADPGNLGTILRTAVAFGAQYVVTTLGSVDPYSPKATRAGMGAHFRAPVYAQRPWGEIRTELAGVKLVAAAAGEGMPAPQFHWPQPAALALGSEAEGLSAEGRALIDEYVHIPMGRGVESLNAAVAAGILMYSALTGKEIGQ
jgi:RNA methyltransferase, TrmH family